MTTKFIYTIYHPHSLVTEFTTDPVRADERSKSGDRVTCKRFKGVI